MRSHSVAHARTLCGREGGIPNQRVYLLLLEEMLIA